MRVCPPPMVAALVVTIVSASCSSGLKRPSFAPTATPAGVRFSLVRAEARSVALAGSFNQWSVSSHPLSRVLTTAIWEVVVPLPPGEHLFMYVVDGTQWITPPEADDFVDDGFGSRNGVVIVPQEER